MTASAMRALKDATAIRFKVINECLHALLVLGVLILVILKYVRSQQRMEGNE